MLASWEERAYTRLTVPRRYADPEPSSAYTDPELRDWLRWASEGGKVPSFVRTVAGAALIACSPDYVLLRPVLIDLKRRHPGAGCGSHKTE